MLKYYWKSSTQSIRLNVKLSYKNYVDDKYGVN